MVVKPFPRLRSHLGPKTRATPVRTPSTNPMVAEGTIRAMDMTSPRLSAGRTVWKMKSGSSHCIV